MTQEQLVETLQNMKRIAGNNYNDFLKQQSNAYYEKRERLAKQLGEDAVKEYSRLETINEILELINQ
jgi:hypothetical protein